MDQNNVASIILQWNILRSDHVSGTGSSQGRIRVHRSSRSLHGSCRTVTPAIHPQCHNRCRCDLPRGTCRNNIEPQRTAGTIARQPYPSCCSLPIIIMGHGPCRILPIIAALLLSMTSHSLSVDAFAAGVPSAGSHPNTPSVEQSAENAADTSSSEAAVPLLPAPDNSDPSIPRIQLGESISLDHMGPIIINTDGTTRTIENWNDMSPQEQQTAWRRIAKRNEERRAALLKRQQQEEEAKRTSETEATEELQE